jgi:hypothetical protein
MWEWKVDRFPQTSLSFVQESRKTTAPLLHSNKTQTASQRGTPCSQILNCWNAGIALNYIKELPDNFWWISKGVIPLLLLLASCAVPLSKECLDYLRFLEQRKGIKERRRKDMIRKRKAWSNVNKVYSNIFSLSTNKPNKGKWIEVRFTYFKILT